METLNLDLLPDEAKREVVQFYNRLLNKYKLKEFSKNDEIQKLKKMLLTDKIKIDTTQWKFNREELYER